MMVLLLLLNIFGLSYASPKHLLHLNITGGSTVAIDQYPHQISLREQGSHICGGSILDATTILTAAHCVDKNTPSIYTVVTGVTSLTQRGNEYQVVDVKPHERYASFAMYDIAILKLGKSITFNKKAKPIEMETSYIGDGVDCIATGWGKLGNNKPTSRDLQYIRLKTISNRACSKMQPHHNPIIPDSEMCTFTQRGQGVCQGDSGGPLIADSKQIGIVSWGRPCGIGYPDVFTRVSSYLDWINANR